MLPCTVDSAEPDLGGGRGKVNFMSKVVSVGLAADKSVS